MHPGRKQEQGFTLVEVLAAVVILSIVSLVLTSYFTNALSYSKTNQNKTIMVNLARNALFYMEKQDFEKMKALFDNDTTISASECRPELSCSYISYFGDGADSSNAEALAVVLNPEVNGIQYEVNVTFQKDLYDKMLSGTDTTLGDGTGAMKQEMAPFLRPVKVEVTGPRGPDARMYTTVVEGYITDEKIR
ncbi:type II secretion system protein [Paenibacillus sp. BR2-3]|uniref:type IV pilus modification PilV family protein n=1 Tax=Paenibacillus sp. BR2-3 TaxID=3048494 RepID=UPI0039777069